MASSEQVSLEPAALSVYGVCVSHWKSIVDPYATRWRAILHYAERGLIHGMDCHRLADPGQGYAWSPADGDSFVREMVEDGALVPVAKDIASAGHSIRAFAGLTGGSVGREKHGSRMTPERWLNAMPAESARFWTFALPKRPV